MEPESAHALVLEALQRASSQNAEILKPAEAKLKEWETQPGFYTALFNVLSNHNLDINVRWLAVLYIKNGVERYWRRNLPNAISEQEKQTLKQGLISNFSEPINQIAVQRAVLISKVARIDCPKEWPELIPTLVQAVESSESLIQHRALLTLHHVVKALSSKCLPGDKRIFQEFAKNIYTFVLNLWNNFTEAFIRDTMHNVPVEQIITNLEKALLTLKVLRKLTELGFFRLHEKPEVMSFLNIIFERARAALQCRKHLLPKGGYVLEHCEKFIIHLTKILTSVLDMHPLSYVDLIQPTLEFTVFYVFAPEGMIFSFERFIIQCFNLIKGVLLAAEFRPAKVIELTKDPETLRAHQIKSAFFTNEVLTEMCKKLVSHYFILTKEDLELWDANPETYANDEGGETWKYSLRPSMETIFVTIFHEFRDVLAPVLMEMITDTNCIVPPEDLPAILRKDAVYNAVGLASYDMYDEVDFDSWFTNTLTQELKIKHNNYRVIRRRVSWLIGTWTGIKLSIQLRPALYDCVMNLLAADEDMAVRLTASMTLRHAIDDFEFNSEQFRPYLDTTFSLLFNLLKEAAECETKMHVLNVMTLVVERVGQTIIPHTDALIHYLPLLWQESEEHNMLRCAIVATLVQLVKALGTVSAELNPFLLPVIQLGTDVTQSAVVYLLEDSLELWLTVLYNSPTMTNELMTLFNNMPALLDYSSENLRCSLLIIHAHLLLSPEAVMRTNGAQIMQIFDSLMSDMRSEGILLINRLLETFIRANPELGCETVKPVLPRIFEYIFVGEDLPIAMSLHLAVLSRVLLTSHTIFTQVLTVMAQKHQVTEENILARILEVWTTKMCNVTQIEQRKLLGLALTNLLTTQSRPVFDHFDSITVNILEVLNDISKQDEDGTHGDSLILTEGRSPSYFHQESDSYYDTDHDQRQKQLILSDPVHNIVLKEYLQMQIFELKNQLGQIPYEQLWARVDNDTISQLKDYINL